MTGLTVTVPDAVMEELVERAAMRAAVAASDRLDRVANERQAVRLDDQRDGYAGAAADRDVERQQRVLRDRKHDLIRAGIASRSGISTVSRRPERAGKAAVPLPLNLQESESNCAASLATPSVEQMEDR